MEMQKNLCKRILKNQQLLGHTGDEGIIKLENISKVSAFGDWCMMATSVGLEEKLGIHFS